MRQNARWLASLLVEFRAMRRQVAHTADRHRPTPLVQTMTSMSRRLLARQRQGRLRRGAVDSTTTSPNAIDAKTF